MSGGGGGGGGSDDTWRKPPSAPKGGLGAGGSPGVGDKCSIVEKTVLNSPNAAVVKTLKPRDVLTLGVERKGPTRVVATTSKGDVAGSITSSRLIDMIECMDNGFKYEAIVLSVAGGKVEVEVRPA